MIATIVTILVILFAPFLIIRLTEKVKLFNKLGSVFLCYLLGIILSFPAKALGTEMSLMSDLSSVLVCIAMPLILFSSDLLSLRSLAKPMLLSFALNTVAVLVVATVGFFVFRGRISEAEKISAMLIGTYTGGTPNMFAIGHALSAGSERIMLAQTSDMIVGGIYFFMLVSFMPALLKKFMPEYKFVGDNSAEEQPVYGRRHGKAAFKGYVLGIALAVLCAAAAMGICLLIPSKYGNAGLAKLGEHTAIIMLLVHHLRHRLLLR